jgi:hypothetical protein
MCETPRSAGNQDLFDLDTDASDLELQSAADTPEDPTPTEIILPEDEIDPEAHGL